MNPMSITNMVPVADHAARQGIPFYFAVLFFVLVGCLAGCVWIGWRIAKTNFEARQRAEDDLRKSYLELTARLRQVEDDCRKITGEFARLQEKSIEAMADVAEAIRDLRNSLHKDHQSSMNHLSR